MLSLLLIFILVIILVRFKISVGLALIAAAVFLGVYYFRLGNQFWRLLYESLVSIRSWRLVFTVALILSFAHIFESAGYVDSLVSSLESFLPPRWVSRIAPAIIGLLPMPGGAMVSAPIVRQLGQNTDVTPEEFTAANYWWRHVWETTWPLYPSIILAAAVLRVSVWDVAIINFPISVVCIATGLMLKKVGGARKNDGPLRYLLLIESLWPILTIVLLGMVFKIDLIISVVLVTIAVIVMKRIPKSTVLGGLAKGFSFGIIALIFGVMTLMLAIEKTGAAAQFYGQLLNLNIPPSIVIFLVPFVIGLLTGVTSAYIGVGFPIVLPLLGSQALSQNAGMLLAFGGGFMGVMASPVHLCLVLTKDYFRASLGKTLRLLIFPILMTSLIAWLLSATLYK